MNSHQQTSAAPDRDKACLGAVGRVETRSDGQSSSPQLVSRSERFDNIGPVSQADTQSFDSNVPSRRDAVERDDTRQDAPGREGALVDREERNEEAETNWLDVEQAVSAVDLNSSMPSKSNSAAEPAPKIPEVSNVTNLHLREIIDIKASAERLKIRLGMEVGS